jgi:hypothetical protein
MQRLTGWKLVSEYYDRKLVHLPVQEPDSGYVVDAWESFSISKSYYRASYRVLIRAPRFGRLVSGWFPLQIEFWAPKSEFDESPAAETKKAKRKKKEVL